MTPVIILNSPQMGENIGMCARAMLNCNLTHLRIVNPRDGWPNDKAVAAAAGALDNGAVNITVYNDLSAAVADLQVTYATCYQTRDLVKHIFDAKQAADDMHTHMASGAKVGVVFGCERSGLTNDDIAQCTHQITIPLNPAFASLNLSQAVLIVAYEIFARNLANAPIYLDHGASLLATQDDVGNLVTRLVEDMDATGFFRSPELRPILIRNLLSFFKRSQPTAQEINTLHGIFTALKRGAKRPEN